MWDEFGSIPQDLDISGDFNKILSLHIYNYMSIKYFWTVTPLNSALKIPIIIRNPEKQAVKWSFFISFYPEDFLYFSINSVYKTGVLGAVWHLSCRSHGNMSLY